MNYKELDNLLTDASAGSRAAECHGFLCGYLCVYDNMQEDTFRKYLLADMTDKEMFAECYKQITELAAEIYLKIASEDFTLELLLPDETCPLSERSEALVQWCEGFLSGLGVAGVTDFDLLSFECRELIQDLYKICRLDAEEINASGDEQEAAFSELTEYVRMGAMLLHVEMHKNAFSAARPDVLH
jgi:uncharacterized protein YgfB (UPF0149 family)